MIERHEADVLNEAREEQLLAVLDADRAREHVARGRRQQRAAPVERIVEPAGLRPTLCHDFSSENDSASEIVAFKPMTISACRRFSVLRWRAYIGEFAIRRIFAVMAGIEREHVGDSSHVGFGIVGELDDLGRDSGRARQVVAAFDLLSEFGVSKPAPFLGRRIDRQARSCANARQPLSARYGKL